MAKRYDRPPTEDEVLVDQPTLEKAMRQPRPRDTGTGDASTRTLMLEQEMHQTRPPMLEQEMRQPRPRDTGTGDASTRTLMLEQEMRQPRPRDTGTGDASTRTPDAGTGEASAKTPDAGTGSQVWTENNSELYDIPVNVQRHRHISENQNRFPVSPPPMYTVNNLHYKAHS
ncbi:hypothetical protein F2P81_016684 [Scophthalmus maximus]|uniref:Uncharacterized protein n=1 Tax=Scophthalmus maximus TaxID=52904 RepID=A0A6A4SHZ2_SCOMX|nr:hypothetical protein F2P81_016684 [Scophthalmus maximus]